MTTHRHYQFGEYILDCENRQLLKTGGHSQETVELAPKELQMLCYLIVNYGKTVTYNDLMQAIWSDEAKTEQSNLKRRIHVHMSNLKNKINDPESLEFIVSVRNHGYRFIAEVKELGSQNTHRSVNEDNKIGLLTPAVADQPKQQKGTEIQRDRQSNLKVYISLPIRKPSPRSLVVIAAVLIGALAGLLVYWGDRCDSQVEPSVTINSDDSWIAIVPPIAEGVRLETGVNRFELAEGDIIEVSASGRVSIGRGCFDPNGEPKYGDPSMDSPFQNRVGGLEMWIGTERVGREFIGTGRILKIAHSGVPTFRVIESLLGYQDGNNEGYFRVKIRKMTKE